jgi:hypothetical protein
MYILLADIKSIRSGTQIIASQKIHERLITMIFFTHSFSRRSIVSVSLFILKDLKIAEYILSKGIIEETIMN